MSLGARLWTYQAERFPLFRTVPLLAVFSAASINVSAVMAGRDLPGAGAYAAGLALGLILFFQMRAADEWKDRKIDAAFRPERPIPRGLVSLRLIIGLGLAVIPVAALVAWGQGVLALLLLVWVWLALMTAEFGVPEWLTARPVLYLVSHMAIMPLIDLLLTGLEWAGRGGPAPALWLFLALSLVNGCVLEIGRKTWAPESERGGVESYSRLWGPRAAAAVWLGFVALAAGLLIALGAATGAPVAVGAVAVIGFAAAAAVVMGFRAAPSVKAEKRVDAAAGLWVLGCYAAAGFLPLVPGVF
ncbi:MAG: UbiA family prenyltransferase [Rhodobacteraceae bacterium]|nr:UbiA family prenyltransferase [Paracoccaceae bacterium]